MNYIIVKNLIEEKCNSIKAHINDLLNILPSQLEEDIQQSTSIEVYKQQIDSLKEELKKVKNENMLLHNQIKNKPKENNEDYNEGELIIKEQTSNKLVSFETEMTLINAISGIYCFSPLLLSDGRIATPSDNHNKSISILTANYEIKKFIRDIHKEKAHNNCIRSFVELNNNRLVSCSDDKTIKIWAIQANKLTEINTLK